MYLFCSQIMRCVIGRFLGQRFLTSTVFYGGGREIPSQKDVGLEE